MVHELFTEKLMLLAHLFLQLWLVMLLLQEVRGWAAFTILCNNVLQGWFFFFFYPLRKLNRQLAAAAAAKSLQLCPTLCDPIDGSPLGSSIHGIIQERVLEWGCHCLHAGLPMSKPSPLQREGSTQENSPAVLSGGSRLPVFCRVASLSWDTIVCMKAWLEFKLH